MAQLGAWELDRLCSSMEGVSHWTRLSQGTMHHGPSLERQDCFSPAQNSQGDGLHQMRPNGPKAGPVDVEPTSR